MRDKKRLWTLFTGMLTISSFTFGGGFVIVGLMKRRFVDELGWLTEEEMLDLTAMAQSSPGAIAVNAAALAGSGTVFGIPAAKLYNSSTLYIMPMVNPDGVDLVTGELDRGKFFENAKRISADYPSIPFPSGWKANIDGIDPNLQYPAGWDNAREIKFSQGYVSPAPRDYVGTAPLVAPESRAVYDFTLQHDFALTISYHTQGEAIFWQYLDYDPENALEIAQKFSRLSGYEVAQVPYESSFAGYKDWFISEYNRPGYTIEAGNGINPLPISQFDKIRADNLGIITTALLPL